MIRLQSLHVKLSMICLFDSMKKNNLAKENDSILIIKYKTCSPTFVHSLDFVALHNLMNLGKLK